MYSSTSKLQEHRAGVVNCFTFLPPTGIKSLFVRQTEGYCGRQTCTWVKARRKGGEDNTMAAQQNPLTHARTRFDHKKRVHTVATQGLSHVCSMLLLHTASANSATTSWNPPYSDPFTLTNDPPPAPFF